MADAGFTHAAGAGISHSATSRRGMLQIERGDGGRDGLPLAHQGIAHLLTVLGHLTIVPYAAGLPYAMSGAAPWWQGCRRRSRVPRRVRPGSHRSCQMRAAARFRLHGLR